MTLNHYVKVQSENVAKVWQMYPKKGAIRLGSDGDLTIVDMNKEATIDPNKLHSKNHPTPWGGWKVKGMPVYTIVRGNVQMKDGEPVGKRDRPDADADHQLNDVAVMTDGGHLAGKRPRNPSLKVP